MLYMYHLYLSCIFKMHTGQKNSKSKLSNNYTFQMNIRIIFIPALKAYIKILPALLLRAEAEWIFIFIL